MFLCRLTFPQSRLHREKTDQEKKEKFPKSRFIRICLKENFHREKKDKEKPFLFLCTIKVFLSLSSLCRSSPWGWSQWILIKNIFLFYLSLSSLCVIYPKGRSVRIKKQKRFFLVFLLSVEALLEADANEFEVVTFYVFFSFFFSLRKSFLAILVDVWSSWSEEHICALYINQFSLMCRAVDLWLVDVRPLMLCPVAL